VIVRYRGEIRASRRDIRSLAERAGGEEKSFSSSAERNGSHSQWVRGVAVVGGGKAFSSEFAVTMATGDGVEGDGGGKEFSSGTNHDDAACGAME
jgi:hypothetical protein